MLLLFFSGLPPIQLVVDKRCYIITAESILEMSANVVYVGKRHSYKESMEKEGKIQSYDDSH